MIKSIRSLAKTVKRDESSVRKWLKNPDWPFGQGPWTNKQVPMIKLWAKSTLSPNLAAEESAGATGKESITTMQNAKLLVLIERARTLRFERELREEKYHLIETCIERRVRQIRALREEFQMVGMRLASSLVGCTAVAIETAINNELRRICEDFANGARGQEETQPKADSTASGAIH